MASTNALEGCNKALCRTICTLDERVSNITAAQFKPNQLHSLGIQVISASFADTNGNMALASGFCAISSSLSNTT
jgi:hypothetical protein